MLVPHPFLRRAALLGTSVALAVPALALTPGAMAAAAVAPSAPIQLRVGGATDPIGIDDLTPDFAWQNTRGLEEQTGFEIRVASSERRLDRPDLWESGRITSTQQAAEYDGQRLDARDTGVWQVRVWGEGNRPTRWSRPATFELGLLDEDDWQGSWITDPRWAEPLHQDVSLGEQSARYLRMTVIDLGRPDGPLDAAEWIPRMELGELQISHGADGANLAEGATVSVSEESSEEGTWAPEYLTDGKVTTADSPRGYRSADHPETDVQDQPIVITIDLGEVKTFDTVRLFSLWDSPGRFGTTPNFPREFSFALSTDGESFSTVGGRRKIEAVSNLHESPEALPVLARDFTTRGRVSSARLYVTGAGVYQASINGRPVSHDVLEPANTQHQERVAYATYDVTKLMRSGRNTVGLELGNGIYNVFNTPDDPKRYRKSASGHGAPRAFGQLEITYADGHREVIATDDSWQSQLGEVTFGSWYGGEDHDARRDLGDWDTPGARRTDWVPAAEVDAPAGDPEVVARVNPPIREVDSLRTVGVSEPKPGVYVFDLGVNFAGWQELTTRGPAGTVLTMRPSERLYADGTVDQRSAGGDIRDTFTLAGKGRETFTPKFAYHGFRYLQVEGLASEPNARDVRGIVLRADNDAVGSFTSSDDMLNGIHRIIDRSVQSNMYSVFTDCPHREKLGWLDQTNLVFDTVAFGYDIQAHYRKMLQDVADAQQADGLIPTTAPEDALFAGAFRHDANWGATLAVSSWQIHEWYGDDSAMQRFWPDMVEYADYLASQAEGGILDGGLGDWITPADPTTPAAVTQTWAYHRILTHMSRIADALGKPTDAEDYQQRAEEVAAAFHREFYDASTGLYGNGDQASQALALEEDLVPAELRQDVLDRFVAMIRDAGDHIEVGEVGLHAAVELLSRERLDDVLYDWTRRTDGVSYGKFLAAGNTSLPESWTNANSSNNHYMLGAIDAWFTSGVAGISQAEGSTAWERVEIEPALVGDLKHAAASYDSVRGTIGSDWTRERGRLSLKVEIPANTTAVVRVPAASAEAIRAPRDAHQVASDVDGFVAYEVGSGTFRFTAELG
ncbi:family 78 glycoside hydrolase catalytic domain [Nocardioides insulae]|uniref:family 78 glycoside hydrolase catalytic domain n=1 Tax=Nocardioides insulae TaxID=394734 RepID=UPI000414DBB9|nr:family 78 glycoside hydrolase catalytic domain [Nocardioides insulae]